MILSGKEIERQVQLKKISIRPFNSNQVNPNSYNLRLSNELYCYESETLDAKKEERIVQLDFNEEGIVLQPSKLYLARTIERTFTRDFVPMLEGRSSIGRLGIFIHVTAGFGDVGFNGYWTLELHCVQPVRIYPYMEVCQIYYHTIQGKKELYKANAKYNNNTGVQPSFIYREFNE